MTHRRPRAEDCLRLAIRDIRAQIKAGDDVVMLADGTKLNLRWRVGPRCYGGGRSNVPSLVCPCCGANCLILRRPPGGSWGCWRCQAVSHPSHRRSGGRGRKPASWHTAKWAEASARVAELLGLAEWPPEKLFWGPKDLLDAPRRADAPRLSERRLRALADRLDALDALSLIAALKGSTRSLPALDATPLTDSQIDGLGAAAEATLAATRWATREGAADPRTASGRRRREPSPTAGR